MVAVVGSDAAASSGRLKCGATSLEVCWGTADSSGSRCCRSKRPSGGFEARKVVVVVDDVVDDVVGVFDGGCACVARGDVAALGKLLGVSTEVWVAVSIV